ncbi:hypothetical protein ASPWEDRAFT_27109 [Aspergillus wentii DTO 134E9]|uniref:Uncharacterized protein n=1 Tax=Aspergillus wentii DTO 134E9 TaxID=1073089 RepID=A0A1L9RS59_ASPWE|nr:uncharacterized protein ASPWEDRAFT_27109 [Aspergillus wentii DTO 134E9]OJJ37752.1 hypothetical protein ASPWEDRAFT_27109 [Aspergillus wentii DTO 134E9]
MPSGSLEYLGYEQYFPMEPEGQSAVSPQQGSEGTSSLHPTMDTTSQTQSAMHSTSQEAMRTEMIHLQKLATQQRIMDNTMPEVPQPRPSGATAICPSLSYLLTRDADTMVYIDPVVPRSQLEFPPTSVPHRVHSEKLLETGSPFFTKLFQPRNQSRTTKRRGLTGPFYNGIKYVLDLTPPSVEDDAVIFITELSCPLGVRTWDLTKKQWGLSLPCIGGEDEMEEQPGYGSGDMEREALPVEYSAHRHRVGIVQVLRALEGFPAQLDTPCKMWTFFALAWLFDVATVPRIGGHMLSWLSETDNAWFGEINPEVTYRIACAIQCNTLCRDIFAILVGEEALLLLANSNKPASVKRPSITFHGRVRESLNDTEVQRIEYAGRSFADYVVGRFVYLAGTDTPWLDKLSEYKKLLAVSNLSSERLKSCIKDFIRGFLYSALQRGKSTWLHESYRTRCDQGYPSGHYMHAYWQMKYAERLMSRTFWKELQTERFGQHEPLCFSNDGPSAISELADYLPAFKAQKDAAIRLVKRPELEVKVCMFNNSLPEPQPPSMSSNVPSQGFEHQLPLRPKFNQSQNIGTVEALGSHVATANEAGTSTDNLEYGNYSTSNETNNSNQVETMTIVEALKDFSDGHAAKNIENNDPIIPDTFPVKVEDVLEDPVQQQTSLSTPARFASDIDFNDGKFILLEFLAQARGYVYSYAEKMLKPPPGSDMRYNLTDTITCLRDHEYRFLPLWADGDDDGTGGVFMDHEIPIVENGGFSAPGPAIHTGSCASSVGSFSVLDSSEYDSTVQGASRRATESHATDVVSLDVPTNSGQNNVEYMSEWQLEDGNANDDASDGSATIVKGSPTLTDFLNANDDLDMDDESDTSFEHI